MGEMATKSKTFWQQYKAYRARVWRRALSDTGSLLGLNKTTIWIILITVTGWLALWFLFKWPWGQLTGQIIPAIAFVIAMIVVGVLILLGRLMAAPVFIDQEQQRAIELPRTPDITLSQLRGHGENIQTIYGTSDSWLVLLRDLILLNRNERDEVVSLKLWWPLKNDAVVFSPQTAPPVSPNIGQVSLLKGVENIPPRRSATGSLLFQIPRSTAPDISVSFFIIIVTSRLSGIECAFNSLTFTEVRKPYPRSIAELNPQLASNFLKAN
jgi:hypothetical protein